MADLRWTRLDGAHRELAAAAPGSGCPGLPVAEVARHWGFVDLERFAVEYRAVYGVSPDGAG